MDVGIAGFSFDQAANGCGVDGVAYDMMTAQTFPQPITQMDLQYEDFFNFENLDWTDTSNVTFDHNDKSFFDFCSTEAQDVSISS